MSVATDKVLNDTVQIEVDGIPLTARRGEMLIEVTDAAGIQIPRFCYHKKLSIAANCRMCLVEVEKVPKPLPACATVVTEGMKVHTRSPKAIEAQQGTMEFLLINHPLDCPICDQGGECELQEISIGYGSDRSDYAEPKRVVRDKDIGPLIETEMTRCIHCTRCVRFGDEIAGIRELGATGRGEHMRIGTYIEQAVTSELSGNVIDLCPVGALTSKPFRYTARAWEMLRHASISPHDCVGSNLTVLTRGHKVMRVDPRENESINECWIADRDRFSYEALNSSERLLAPMLKRDGQWQQVDWNTALEAAVKGIAGARASGGPAQIGALMAPGSTLEEMYLAQQLMRALGSDNIDHRLRQTDFRGQDHAPAFPWLGQPIAALENIDAALLIGSLVRKDQPLIGQRLRKAALRGAAVMFLNPVAWEFNFPVAANIAAAPAAMVARLAAIARAVLELNGEATPPAGYERLLQAATVDDEARAVARRLVEAKQGTVLLGNIAAMHPDYSTLCALAQLIADSAKAKIGYLSEGANGAGAWLAGAIPHRGPGGAKLARSGLDAQAMVDSGIKAWLLLNVEPDRDSANPARTVAALERADFVVALSTWRDAAIDACADVLLPVTPFTETSGTFVNAEGRWQAFNGVVTPAGEARPAWKVLRVLGNLFDLPGFDYLSTEEIRAELRNVVGDVTPTNAARWPVSAASAAESAGDAVMRVSHVPIYGGDPLIRRAGALQQTVDAREAARVTIGSALARQLGVADGERITVRQEDAAVALPVTIDDRVAAGCALIPAGLAETAALGALFGPVKLERHKHG